MARLQRLIPLNQILLILMGILVVYLMVDFGRQVGLSHQRRQELDQIEQQIQAALTERSDLEGQLAQATSSEAVEAWARRNGLTRENEVLVVFFGGPPREPSIPLLAQGSPFARPEALPASPREAWWDLFFGTR